LPVEGVPIEATEGYTLLEGSSWAKSGCGKRRFLAFGWDGIEVSGLTYDVVGDESSESSSEVFILEVAWSSRFERGEVLLFLENRPPKNGIGWKAKVVASKVWHLECCPCPSLEGVQGP